MFLFTFIRQNNLLQELKSDVNTADNCVAHQLGLLLIYHLQVITHLQLNLFFRSQTYRFNLLTFYIQDSTSSGGPLFKSRTSSCSILNIKVSVAMHNGFCKIMQGANEIVHYLPSISLEIWVFKPIETTCIF